MVPIYVFPKIKLLFPKQNYNILSSSSYTHISVRDLCIYIFPGSVCPQSRQSAKLFLQSSELGLPNPSPCRRVCPPPLVPGGGAHSLTREGVGESQFRRGDIHCGTLYIYVLCESAYSAAGKYVD
jgi:hypothetical protein